MDQSLMETPLFEFLEEGAAVKQNEEPVVPEEEPATDDEKLDTQHHEPRRGWLKHGKGLLLATLVLFAVVAGTSFAKTTARSPARSSGMDQSQGLTDVGASLAALTASKSWNEIIPIYNGIAADTYDGTDPGIQQIRDLVAGDAPRRVAVLLSMKSSCLGDHLPPAVCAEVVAAYEKAIAPAPTTPAPTTPAPAPTTPAPAPTTPAPAPAPPAGSMEPCGTNADCAPGLICDVAGGTEACVSPNGLGGTCDTNADCEAGLVCGDDGCASG